MENYEGDMFANVSEIAASFFIKFWGNVSGNTSSLLWKGGNGRSDGFKVALQYLFVYVTPVIIAVGLAGNLLSLIVFTFSHLQRLSSSVYLSSLSLADMGFLGALFFVWLDRIGFHVFSREGWCQAVLYVTHVCGFLAVWTVVSFTAERYIIVYHSLRKDAFCTRARAKLVVLCLCIYSATFYLYIFWTYDVIRLPIPMANDACAPLPRYQDVNFVMNSIHTLCAGVIPTAITVFLNVKIIIKIHKFQARKIENIRAARLGSEVAKPFLHAYVSDTGSVRIKFYARSPEEEAEAGGTLTHSHTPKARYLGDARRPNHTYFRIARMLLVLSSISVLLNLPIHAFRVQGFLHQVLGRGPKQPRAVFIWHEVFQLIYFFNFAINIFIYSACGRQFRNGLRRLCQRWYYNIRKFHQIARDGCLGANRDIPLEYHDCTVDRDRLRR